VVRTPFQAWFQTASAPGWTGRFARSHSLGGRLGRCLRSVLADRGRWRGIPALVPQIADDHRTVSDLELRAAGVADPYPFDEAKRVC
jgi:hypothetical protein